MFSKECEILCFGSSRCQEPFSLFDNESISWFIFPYENERTIFNQNVVFSLFAAEKFNSSIDSLSAVKLGVQVLKKLKRRRFLEQSVS